MKNMLKNSILFNIVFICIISGKVFSNDDGRINSQSKTNKSEKPKPTSITIEGILGKRADGYFLTMKDNGFAYSDPDISVKVPEAEMSALKSKHVEIKGMGYSYSTLIDKKRKIMMTAIDSIKEVFPKSKPLTVAGILSKKDDGFIVTMASKEVIEITNENKGGISADKLEKMLGRRVILIGKGYLRNGHVFTSISSIEEPELILEGKLSKKENKIYLITFAGEEVLLPLDENSKIKPNAIEKLLENRVIVKGTGGVELGKNIYTGISSITEPLPESSTLVVKGTLSKKGNSYILTTADEKEVLNLKLDDKSTVKFSNLEKLDGKSVEIRGKGYKKEGTHFTQIDSVKEIYIKD